MAVQRRIDRSRWSFAEVQIQYAIDAVEASGVDVRLTDAVTLLSAARESVADHFEGVDARRFVEHCPGSLEARTPAVSEHAQVVEIARSILKRFEQVYRLDYVAVAAHRDPDSVCGLIVQLRTALDRLV